MILGIGNDLVQLSRIQRILEQYPHKFLHKYFLESEITYAQKTPHRMAEKIASCWAIKEATAKALGTGIIHDITLNSIELVRLHTGAPHVVLHAGSHNQATRLANGEKYDILSTVTHDAGMVLATVVVSK